MSVLNYLRLGEEPYIAVGAVIDESVLGAYSFVGKDSVVSRSTIGAYAHIGNANDIFASNIGKFASFATGVRINPVQHPTYSRVVQSHITYRCELYGFGENDYEFLEQRSKRTVNIGHDVWIGHNATIQGNVNIGNGAVIGSMAVVTKDVEPYSIVVGNPAREIKKRFDPSAIDAIQKSEWWNWDHEQIKERLLEFNDIAAFCKKYG
ncbi:MAG TPA: acetyltransferase [Coriobacteriia bacterium]|nr:acetyltransferase [Coriobacteriia bacterium]